MKSLAPGRGKADHAGVMKGQTAARIRRAATRDRTIQKARREIDAIDRAIVRQLAARACVVAEISRIRGARRRDPEREREVVRNAVQRYRRLAPKDTVGYTDESVADIFRAILEAGEAIRAGAHKD